ncbi:MAG: LPS assembly lipoprotein LptE [Burkholderiales bacterium]|jgi:LPS-assembly lipoprotein|nr:LPS assembly lipoprotein LptE [Burkholderiales bacterium]
MRRRALLLGSACALGLSACGFRLRGSATLPFDTLYLALPANSSFGAELARNLRAGTNVKLVDKRDEAQAILEVGADTRDREVVSVNAQGQVREVRLRQTVTVRVTDGKGRDFLPSTTLFTRRDVSYDERQVLASQAEEALIYRDMQTDLVQQLLRRLSALQP